MGSMIAKMLTGDKFMLMAAILNFKTAVVVITNAMYLLIYHHKYFSSGVWFKSSSPVVLYINPEQIRDKLNGGK